ncbi:MAG: response regulator transcription factor [Acidobacteria bacterium]|nr:response regulator transcription factor [Acidobacteriota bacterium]
MTGAASLGNEPRILVVEDEFNVAGALREGLEAEGYRVCLAHTGEDGFFQASNQPFELMILDRMLPGRDGLEILAALRRAGFLTPVLVLTARDGVEDRVAGLDAGADDYLVKPFAFAELLARVRALVRRSRGDQLLRLTAGDLVIEVAGRTVTRGGEPVDLTTREYELFEYLVRHKGTLVSREMLARDVWGETERCTPLDNVIDVHIARLRKKIDTGETRLIHTVRGVGFIVREGE